MNIYAKFRESEPVKGASPLRVISVPPELSLSPIPIVSFVRNGIPAKISVAPSSISLLSASKLLYRCLAHKLMQLADGAYGLVVELVIVYLSVTFTEIKAGQSR